MRLRRAPLVLAGTAAGLAGVLLFHPHSSGLALGTIPSASGGTFGFGTSARTSTGSSGVSGRSSASSPGSGASTGSSSTQSSGGATTTTYTGKVVTFRYGDVSVRITVSGNRITKVGLATLTEGVNPRSQSLDRMALPILEQQALAAQSANIQGVSGASYTSEGFASSLQSVLNKEGL